MLVLVLEFIISEKGFNSIKIRSVKSNNKEIVDLGRQYRGFLAMFHETADVKFTTKKQ